MKNLLLFIFVMVLTLNKVSAQNFKTDSISKQHLQKLHWLTGNWEGSGWHMDQAGTRRDFSQTEKVQFKLDSTALLIEGQGHAENELIHNAMAVVTFDHETGKYEFQSFLQNGKKGNFNAELKDDRFYWYPNSKVRYIIALDKNGDWKEVGEYKGENGWYQFFEMKLSKI